MWDPAYEQVVIWAGLAVLLVLCLPWASLQRLVLNVYAWALRLALVALLAGGGYLWLHPEALPAEVTDLLSRFPLVATILPETDARHFGVCAAALVVAIFLPILAALDVARKLAGWRLRRLRAVAAEHAALAEPPATEPTSHLPRRVDRTAAAAALAGAGAAAGPRRP